MKSRSKKAVLWAVGRFLKRINRTFSLLKLPSTGIAGK
jgi:hypothetical protein